MLELVHIDMYNHYQSLCEPVVSTNSMRKPKEDGMMSYMDVSIVTKQNKIHRHDAHVLVDVVYCLICRLKDVWRQYCNSKPVKYND